MSPTGWAQLQLLFLPYCFFCWCWCATVHLMSQHTHYIYIYIQIKSCCLVFLMFDALPNMVPYMSHVWCMCLPYMLPCIYHTWYHQQYNTWYHIVYQIWYHICTIYGVICGTAVPCMVHIWYHIYIYICIYLHMSLLGVSLHNAHRSSTRRHRYASSSNSKFSRGPSGVLVDFCVLGPFAKLALRNHCTRAQRSHSHA